MGLELFADAAGRRADGDQGARRRRRQRGAGKLEKQYGLKLANGQDTLKGKILRLAHMGYIDQFDVLAALAGLELVLLEMGHGVEPGAGVAAFQRALRSRSRCRRRLSRD